jgi:hypothetical protein
MSLKMLKLRFDGMRRGQNLKLFLKQVFLGSDFSLVLHQLHLLFSAFFSSIASTLARKWSARNCPTDYDPLQT